MAERPIRAPSSPRVIASGGLLTLDPDRDARWASWVRSREDGVVFQHPAWMQVLRRAYGYPPICLALEDAAGRLRGVLPLVSTRGVVTGRRLSSLPHTPVAGPLADAPEIASELLQAAMAVAGATGRRLLVKAPSAGLARDVPGVTCVPWDSTYVVDLPGRPQELRFGSPRNHARIRWAVRKGERMGLAVREADTPDDLRAWYGLYLETMRSHAVPPRPYRLFAAMWDLLRPAGMMRLVLAEHVAGARRRLLAGSVILTCGQTAAYAFNGRRPDLLALRPNDAIQWTVIPQLCAAGVRFYDLGEVGAGQVGLADFKRKWGASARPLYRYHYPRHAGQHPDTLGAGAPWRRAADAAWRRMPLAATAPVGDWLYRHA